LEKERNNIGGGLAPEHSDGQVDAGRSQFQDLQKLA
jgi:hypothetical protein